MQLEQLLYRTEQLFTCCCWLFSMNPSSVGPRRMYGVAQGSSSAVKDNNISETSCLRSLGCCEASSLFQLKSTACNEAPAIPIFIYSSICSKQNIWDAWNLWGNIEKICSKAPFRQVKKSSFYSKITVTKTIWNCDKKRYEFLHESVLKEPTPSLRGSGKAFLGNDRNLRLQVNKGALWQGG